MTPEEIAKKEALLNQKCMECIKKNGVPSSERCEYYCPIGKEIHMLDFQKNNGWGNHDYWKKPR